MKRIVKLTESDLTRIVKRILKEEECVSPPEWLMNFKLDGKKGTSDCSNWNWRSSDKLFVWISLKDKMLSVTTELDLDETSKKSISSAMGTQPKTKSTTLNWTKTFMSSEEGGDLNRTLNGLQGHIPWISNLQESIVKRVIKEQQDKTTPEAKAYLKKMYDSVMDGRCFAKQVETPNVGIKCKDGTEYRIQMHRRFGS